MKNYILLTAAVATLVSCGEKEEQFDATGTFEATEIVVSAEQNGKLLTMNIEEGDKVEAHTEVALIDTTQLWLKARQIGATQMVYAAQRPDIQKQIASTNEQLKKAREEEARFSKLVKEGAANSKTLDDAQSQVAVLEKQLAALVSTLNTQTNSLNAQVSTADVEKLIVADQLTRCHILSPISGIILEKYMEAGEFATIGKPVFKIADTDHMLLRAYVTSLQLEKVHVGQKVKVWADFGDGNRRAYDGTVEWISSKSEFTPKTILTDDERADLVYAVKVAVRNDGAIKIGMYGEMRI